MEMEEPVESNESNEMIFKIILIGDTSTGKTHILSRYINNKFEEDTKPTIGVELSSKSFMINNDIINIQIWDTAGQERYKSITKAYYKGALGALVVYDISKKETFESVDKWINDLKHLADQKVSIILVGNKSDLENERQVSKEEGQMKAQSNGLAFLEASALNGNNIELAFKTLVEEVYNKCHTDFEAYANISVTKGKTITVEDATTQKKKQCCTRDSIRIFKKK